MMEHTLTLSPALRLSQSVCWNMDRSISWPPPSKAWGEEDTDQNRVQKLTLTLNCPDAMNPTAGCSRETKKKKKTFNLQRIPSVWT